MTISQLAKIAYDEQRSMKVKRETWGDEEDEILVLEGNGRNLGFCNVRFCTNELAATDWYEVKE